MEVDGMDKWSAASLSCKEKFVSGKAWEAFVVETFLCVALQEKGTWWCWLGSIIFEVFSNLNYFVPFGECLGSFFQDERCDFRDGKATYSLQSLGKGISGMRAVQVWALLITCSSDQGAELSWECKNASERRMMWNCDTDLLKTFGNLKSVICLLKLRQHSLQFLQFSSFFFKFLRISFFFFWYFFNFLLLLCELALNLWTTYLAYSELCKLNNKKKKTE